MRATKPPASIEPLDPDETWTIRFRPAYFADRPLSAEEAIAFLAKDRLRWPQFDETAAILKYNEENNAVGVAFDKLEIRFVILATGLDMDGDEIEDWGVIVEEGGRTATYAMCYPAILSRIKDAEGVMGVFYVKKSAPWGRCA